MNVVMIGAGYVGLVSGACFAEFGASVVCVDKQEERITALRQGKIPIYEPGLEDLVRKNADAGRLSFTTDVAGSVAKADLAFIAVGTPTRRGDGHADLKYVYAAAQEIAENLQGYTVIVDKSTVPVGTAREVARVISKTNPDADFDVASNPEFLREGSAISDFLRPDRVVLGVESERAEARLRELYRPLNLIEAPLLVTGLESAELIKYAANAFLATKISFINEMSQLCEKTGADVNAVAKGMGMDKRIGNKFLHAGPGYGGSCFPKDTLALNRMAQEYGVGSRIVEAVVEVNASQKARMVSKIREALGGSEADKRIAVLGLTFKPETDDMRDAPALAILPALIDRGATICAHDPEGMDEARPLLPEAMEYADTIEEALKDADAVVLMTEWNQYRGLNLRDVRDTMRGDVFVDLRNVYERGLMEAAGLQYTSVGR
ncbi:UDP-glucose dehydrogenase family protein [Congregibacter litoralis]|uniref:UDP-glucose 6-dehydrogenase n=1 Tax=Congregibacter litoralis KT71 TaxID=314285 RepID=A4ADJ3_9GAMM|nr:UDP-glucose/GDP-mannose dehydrogenase family protein [Congregibacter litoralis]EAQ95991.1 nucleotide sugar dehydrogenase [Congregibacter litoralis KT71]